jgi:hypothetical protein
MDFCSLSMPRIESAIEQAIVFEVCGVRTFVPQVHFYFKRLEFFRGVGLRVSTHLLASPLLKATEFLVDIHDERLFCSSGVSDVAVDD